MIFTEKSFAVIYGNKKEALDILDLLVSLTSTFPIPQIEMSSIENISHHHALCPLVMSF